jgi:hypothetical protein
MYTILKIRIYKKNYIFTQIHAKEESFQTFAKIIIYNSNKIGIGS